MRNVLILSLVAVVTWIAAPLWVAAQESDANADLTNTVAKAVANLAAAQAKPAAHPKGLTSEQKIQAVLDSQLPAPGFDFADVPLADVAGFLKDLLQIRVMLDTKALEDAGVQ